MGSAVLRAGCPPVACFIRDLSVTCVRIELENVDMLGRHVHLRLGNDPRAYFGRVRWVRDGVVGLELVERRDLPEFLSE